MRNSCFSGYCVLYILLKFIVMNAEFKIKLKLLISSAVILLCSVNVFTAVIESFHKLHDIEMWRLAELTVSLEHCTGVTEPL